MTKSVIEEDLIIEGNIASKDGDIEVKGQVKGDVTGETVSVHTHGNVTGAIKATSVRVQGRHGRAAAQAGLDRRRVGPAPRGQRVQGRCQILQGLGAIGGAIRAQLAPGTAQGLGQLGIDRLELARDLLQGIGQGLAPSFGQAARAVGERSCGPGGSGRVALRQRPGNVSSSGMVAQCARQSRTRGTARAGSPSAGLGARWIERLGFERRQAGPPFELRQSDQTAHQDP